MCRASVTAQTPADNKKNRLKSLLSHDKKQQSRLQHERYGKLRQRVIFFGKRAACSWFKSGASRCATQSTCRTFAAKYLKTNLDGKSGEMPCVTSSISVAGVTQTVLHSSICGQHCRGVTLVTPKCFLLPNIEVTRIQARWTKLWTLTVWRANAGNGLRGQRLRMSAFLLTLGSPCPGPWGSKRRSSCTPAAHSPCRDDDRGGTNEKTG